MSNSNMENYRKIEIVGKGSFGCAVLVQSVVDRKYYIMKIIDVSKMDRKQKEEALNEVTFLKAMRHPYIITYRESFMDRNRYLCIVMDYAEGGDIYGKIAKQRKLGKSFPESQILDWFVQICLALKYVHDRKILHRDLKTQNIFLTANGDVKIGDFGIARVLQDTYDCAQTAIGTPYYLSPEICQEKPYNQKSDIWSLGCILYEMITLRHAFDANSMKGLVLKILRGSYPSIPSNYSPELRDLIGEMLTKDPAKRPSIKKILEKDFLSSRIANLVTNTIVKHELGNTLLKKVSNVGIPNEPSLNPNPKEVNSSQKGEANMLADRSSSILNQHDVRKSSNSVLKGLDDDNKKILGVNNSNITNPIVNNVSSVNSVSSVLAKKSSQSYIPTDVTNLQPKEQEPVDKKRSSSITRGQESEYVKKVESVRSSSRSTQEEQKQSNSKAGLISNKGSPYIQKENRPGAIYSNSPMTAMNKEEEEELTNLINDAKEFEKKKGQSNTKKETEEEYFEEEEHKRVKAKFLTIDGKELPGCGDKDTMSYRIEALRYYLEKQVGADQFYEAYKFVQSPPTESDNNSELVKILGKTNIKFVPLIYQLIVCEDNYYGS